MSKHSQTIGLIAGNGKFPFLLAKAARDQGMRVVAAGIRGDTSFLLKPFVDDLRWFRVGDLSRLFDFFVEQQIQKVVMAGQVSPHNLFDPRVHLDSEFQDLFSALEDRRADTIFSAVAGKLHRKGMELLDSTSLLEAYLAPRGTLTRRGPTREELADIEFGREIAKNMGALDVGQTVVIKDKAIVAIEAMEGTDQCILRGGAIANQKGVVVKMSKPDQDQRFDVPVIGSRTIRNMRKSHCRCLAIEAGKTLVIDQAQCVKLANRSDICIVSV